MPCHARFARNAPLLATQAAERALADSGSQPDEIDALVISTCTGYLCPGLTSYVCEQLGCRPDVLAFDLVGQGCGAALPNFCASEALLTAGRCRRVLSICVEVCSAALYFDDDPGVLISACLFGDGAGAAELANSPNGKRPVKWKANGSRLQPKDRDLLRFKHKDGMLRNILTPQVPAVAARLATMVLDEVLARSGARRSVVKAWVKASRRSRRVAGVARAVGVERARPALERRRAAGLWELEQRVGVLRAASRAGRFRARRLLVDGVVWRRVQFSWRAAGSTMNAMPAPPARRPHRGSAGMKRRVTRELLDELPPADSRAVRSRDDLLRVNAWMGNQGIMARALRSSYPGRRARRIIELGAGDGRFLLRVARRLVPDWQGTGSRVAGSTDDHLTENPPGLRIPGVADGILGNGRFGLDGAARSPCLRRHDCQSVPASLPRN